MAGEFFHTIGDESQLPGMFNGKFMMGRREARLAFVGRSNVGKSSLINALMGGTLARVSAEPGKTRSIHLYFWKDAKKFIADLPGYGYAKQSKEERDRWARFINGFISADEGLERAVVLLDSRHGPTDKDIEAIKFLSFESVPVTFVLTKVDQIKTQSERAARKKEVTAALLELGYSAAHAFWVSVKDKKGIDALSRELIADAPPTVSE